MSEDMQRLFDSLAPAPAIILVRPWHPANIGAVARAMLNFGLADLRLVEPKEQPWLTDEALSLACEARLVLENAREFASVDEAIADLQLVMATSARPRGVAKPSAWAREACCEAAAACARGAAVGILFGSERGGLQTSELRGAHTLVRIPAQEGCCVLNLAQAVVVVAYEFRQAADELAAQAGAALPLSAPTADAEPATVAQIERLLGELLGGLRAAQWPPSAVERREEAAIARARDMLLRARPSKQEMKTLFGMALSLARAVQQGEQQVSAPHGDAEPAALEASALV